MLTIETATPSKKVDEACYGIIDRVTYRTNPSCSRSDKKCFKMVREIQGGNWVGSDRHASTKDMLSFDRPIIEPENHDDETIVPSVTAK